MCGQCRKLNLHCAGYERDTIWVNLTSDNGLVRRPKRQVSPTVTLSETFARSAYHEQYLGLFWQSYLPAGKAFSAESNKYVAGMWMNQIHKMARQDNEGSVRRILLAISLTSIGRRDNTPWMVENGIQLYGSSLATLAHQLKDPIALGDDNNYVASRLLSLYEVLRLRHPHTVVVAGHKILTFLSPDSPRARPTGSNQPNQEMESAHLGRTRFPRVTRAGKFHLWLCPPAIRRRKDHAGMLPLFYPTLD